MTSSTSIKNNITIYVNNYNSKLIVEKALRLPVSVAIQSCTRSDGAFIYVSPQRNDQAEGSLSHLLRSIQATIEKANRTESLQVFTNRIS